jgi:hypothetical protein
MVGRVLLVPIVLFALAWRPHMPFNLHALQECTATFDPDTVLRGAESVRVTYELSEEIGAISEVSPDVESGIHVLAMDSTHSSITLNTTSAVVGDWQLLFLGENERTCQGTLGVAGI